MFYVTIKQPPKYHQITLEEFLLLDKRKPVIYNNNPTNTKTYYTENAELKNSVSVEQMIKALHNYNEQFKNLISSDKKSLYKTFYIPKRSGGLRKIDAPCDELMNALRVLKSIFENDYGILYHTSAFAYIKGRCTIDAVKKHQNNESKWFAKFDLSNFFGSTTIDFVMKQFSTIFPLSVMMETERGYNELKTAISLAFLDGGLPQGTPISPTITNIMMIPIDYTLNKWFRQNGFVYTRYADDFIVSSKYQFECKNVESKIIDVLNSFDAPFSIKKEKTRFGKSNGTGSNWMLGVMLNQDNKITIGAANKRRFKAMLTSYALDKINGKKWNLSDIQIMDGHRSYYMMVEPDSINEIVNKLSSKFNIDIIKSIKEDISNI